MQMLQRLDSRMHEIHVRLQFFRDRVAQRPDRLFAVFGAGEGGEVGVEEGVGV